ncbi:SUN domain-containing protein 3-like [Porphyrio hochstetteri]
MVTLLLLACLLSFGVYYVGQHGDGSLWRTAKERLHLPEADRKSQRPAADEHGLVALGESSTWQEQQLFDLQEELYHLRWSANDLTENSLWKILKEAKLQGITGWAAQEIISDVLKKQEEKQVPLTDYALKSSGAAVIHSKTSPSYRNTKAKVFWNSLLMVDYMRSPEVILEAENHLGNCWAFPGSRASVLIQLSVPVIPRAVTMDHASGSAFHPDSILRAPKDFAVYGLKDGHEGEEEATFLGHFTFMAVLTPSQTFQLQNELSEVMTYIRLDVLSNWGHADYTCLYRFRVHGDHPKAREEVSSFLGQ